MSRDFFEDDYKDMDPLGFYDLDGDGSYDDDERFYIDEEIRMEEEEIYGAKRRSGSYDDDFDDSDPDEEDYDDYDDDFEEDELSEYDSDDEDEKDGEENEYDSYIYSESFARTTLQTPSVDNRNYTREISAVKENKPASKTDRFFFSVSVVILHIFFIMTFIMVPLWLFTVALGATNEAALIGLVLSLIIAIPATIIFLRKTWQ